MSHGFTGILTGKPASYDVDSLVMHIPPVDLKYSELTEKIIGVFYDVYNELGYGFLESTYSEAMSVALQQAGLHAAREISVPVWFRGVKIGQDFADLMVQNSVLLELKTARTLESAQEAQLLHYLRATERGLLLNFGVRPQFRRLLFDNDRKQIRENPCESVAKGFA